MQLPHSLRALGSPNFRLYYAGQAVSMLGTWIQSVALMWLAYRLSGSTYFTGLIGFLNNVPHLFLAPFAGVLGDRLSRRRMLMTVLSLLTVQSAILAVLSGLHIITLWELARPRPLRGDLQRVRDAHAPVVLRAAAGEARGPAQRDRDELDPHERHAARRALPWAAC